MKAVIFDLDGTLLDTLTDIALAANAALTLNGYPPHPVSAYRQMVGCGFPILMQRAVPQNILHNLTSDNMDTLVSHARAYYVAHPSDHTLPYPGIPEVLAAITDLGIHLAVLSNKMDDLTKILIQKHFSTISFTEVLGSKPHSKLKPHPTELETAEIKEKCKNGVAKRFNFQILETKCQFLNIFCLFSYKFYRFFSIFSA